MSYSLWGPNVQYRPGLGPPPSSYSTLRTTIMTAIILHQNSGFMCQSSALRTQEPVRIISLPSSLEGGKAGSEKGEGEEEKKMKEKIKEAKQESRRVNKWTSQDSNVWTIQKSQPMNLVQKGQMRLSSKLCTMIKADCLVHWSWVLLAAESPRKLKVVVTKALSLEG